MLVMVASGGDKREFIYCIHLLNADDDTFLFETLNRHDFQLGGDLKPYCIFVYFFNEF